MGAVASDQGQGEWVLRRRYGSLSSILRPMKPE